MVDQSELDVISVVKEDIVKEEGKVAKEEKRVSKEIIGKFKRGDRVVVKKENDRNNVYTSGQVMRYDPILKKYHVNGVCSIKGLKQRPNTVLPLVCTFMEEELELEE
jgi:hypothetical protein